MGRFGRQERNVLTAPLAFSRALYLVMMIPGFAGRRFHGANEEQDGAERRVGNSIDFERPPATPDARADRHVAALNRHVERVDPPREAKHWGTPKGWPVSMTNWLREVDEALDHPVGLRNIQDSITRLFKSQNLPRVRASGCNSLKTKHRDCEN
jgi:hypothetical protein